MKIREETERARHCKLVRSGIGFIGPILSRAPAMNQSFHRSNQSKLMQAITNYCRQFLRENPSHPQFTCFSTPLHLGVRNLFLPNEPILQNTQPLIFQ